ncbi:MAG TPA: UPF0149 family protein [Xylella sp.]
MRLPEATAVQQQSRQLGLSATAAELHGGLSGLLAGGGGRNDWLAVILANVDIPLPAAGSALERLYQTTVLQLDDPDFSFELLLTDDGATLAARADALFDWCRAFLGGFGLAAQHRSLLSEESDEALRDLAKLAQASVDDFEMTEDEDEALQEIEEFVRVAVLVLHVDCTLGKRFSQHLN